MENKCCVLGKGWGIVIGAVVLGVSIILAVSNFKSYDRTVTVKGLCEMEVKADKVIFYRRGDYGFAAAGFRQGCRGVHPAQHEVYHYIGDYRVFHECGQVP